MRNPSPPSPAVTLEVARVLGEQVHACVWAYQGYLWIDYAQLCRSKDREPTLENQALVQEWLRRELAALVPDVVFAEQVLDEGRN